MRIMKNIKKYFGLTLIALLFSVVFSACEDKDEIGSDNIGLGIKVFSPTKVVPGQPVTINGSGFGEVTEVVFPGGVAVKNFELVSNEMIRVVTPSGINIPEEGEKLIVRSADDEAESPRLMTQGNTQPRTYSAEPGEEVKTNSIIKIFGKDMEFVNKVTFTDKEDNPLEILAKDFYRIATNSVSIKIPSSIKEGLQVGYFETLDGKRFELPEYNFKAGGGHWEIKKNTIWKNDGSVGDISWSGNYRFGLDGNDGNNECVATFDADTWNIIKTGTFQVIIEGASPQIRVTTGWWSTTWTGNDIFPGNELLVDNGDGTMTLTVNLTGDPILDLLDAQHLLFTGSGYKVLEIFTQEEVWVEEEEGHMERKYIWKNDGSLGDISWSGSYRFGLEGNDGNNECAATFDADTWEFIKTGTFQVEIEGASPQIRVTTGWWSTTWTGDDIFPGNELLVDNGDGTMTLTVNLSGDPILDLLDAQHLLFTGSGYKVNAIYYDEWISGSAPKEVVFWENGGSLGDISWSGSYRFGLEGNDGNNECAATFDASIWEIIKTGTFYIDIEGENPQIRVTNGWWDSNWGDDIFPGNDLLVDNGDGTMTLTINFGGADIVGTLDQKHLLFTGSGYKVLKIYTK